MKRLLLLSAALLACGLIASGCGDDDDNGGDDSVATTETAPVAPTQTEPTEELGGGAVDECMEHVRAQIELEEQLGEEVSDGFRSELEAVCDDVTDAEDIPVALSEICKLSAEEFNKGDEFAREACKVVEP
jgi:hypothetical protein